MVEEGEQVDKIPSAVQKAIETEVQNAWAQAAGGKLDLQQIKKEGKKMPEIDSRDLNDLKRDLKDQVNAALKEQREEFEKCLKTHNAEFCKRVNELTESVNVLVKKYDVETLTDMMDDCVGGACVRIQEAIEIKRSEEQEPPPQSQQFQCSKCQAIIEVPEGITKGTCPGCGGVFDLTE